MTPTDWQKHIHDPGNHLTTQHGPNMHTHGTDGKVDTIMGKPYPPQDHSVECPRCMYTFWIECEDE